MNVFLGMFYSFILVIVVIYSWYKYSKVKVNYSNYKLYIAVIFMTIATTLNFFVINKYFRILLITSFFILIYSFIFNVRIQKKIITPIYIQFLTILSETIYTTILIIIFKGDINKLLITPFGTFLTNLSVALILFILVNFKFVNMLYNKLLRLTDRVKYVQLIFFCFILMLITNILVMTTYYKIEFIYYFIFNISMIIICVIIMLYTMKTQNNYNKVSDKYNVAKTSLRDYENMMNKYKIAAHENKNLLLTLRTMTINKEKNIPEYIDSIIENKFKDDEKLLHDMSVIPTGGLRATIYSEILKIKENNINYSLNIDKKISTIDLIELDTDTIIDICKIIGVFMDNSIEAVKSLKKKVINIDLYLLNNKLCIKVSNNYKGIIDISKLNDEGYTTKEEGHGYGLSLVKEIINNNNNLENETLINKSIFSQILKITYKKNH